MIRIAICDDEKVFRDKIRDSVSRYMTDRKMLFQICDFSSGEEFLADMSNISQFSVLFLDIDMQGMNGITLAKEIRKVNREAHIAFVTAYIDYSLEGYRVEAIRYILKDNRTLEPSIEECLDTIFEKMQKDNSEIFVSFQEGKKRIKVNHIMYVESSMHKLTIYMEEAEKKTYTLYDKLDNFESQLSNNNFLRVHQSFLVNMQYIDRIKNRELFLKDGTEIMIPKARYRDVLNRFVVFMGEM